ncbi:hypothetical protein [Vibrio sp. HN007]|uniref:hypothetical protein n=1 Tax=Vibrio iocasae TaxID=3098914 RepID=UPI0035D47373
MRMLFLLLIAEIEAYWERLKGKMTEFNSKCYRLSDIEPAHSIVEKLKTCLINDISVFIRVPSGVRVWVIDPKLDQLTVKDVILSQGDYINRSRMHRHFYGTLEFLHGEPKIRTTTMISSTLIDNVEYLKIYRSDMEVVLDNGECTTNRFNGFICRNIKIGGNIKDLKDGYIAAYGYIHEFDNFYGNKSTIRLFPVEDTQTVLCSPAVIAKGEFNFPIGYIEYSSFSLSDLHIQESSIPVLMLGDSAYKSSRYYLEPKFHVSSSFLELSKSGYYLYDKYLSSVSGGVSGYLARNYPLSFKTKKLQEAGGFLINPKPQIKNSGQKKVEGCFFPYLKEVFNQHWLPLELPKGSDLKQKREDVINDLLRLGMSNYYAEAAEFIIRPDQYKKIKKSS